MSRTAGSSKMVGRLDELEQLFDGLGETIAGNGCTIAIEGEAGMGKTRLIEEFLAMGKGLDCLFASGSNAPRTSVPYSSFIQVLQGLKNALGPSCDLESLICSLRNDPPTSNKEDAQYERERVILLLTDRLRAISHKHPLVLVIEDLHWADSLSIDLFSSLSRNLKGHPIMFLCSFRPEQFARSSEDVQRSLGGLIHSRDIEFMVLRGLGESDCNDLISSIIGRKSSPETIKAIYSASEGNPLFLQEFALSMIKGKRRGPYGQEESTLEIVLPIPDSINAIVQARVSSLPQRDQVLVMIASAIGTTVRINYLADLIGTSMESTSIAMERMARNNHFFNMAGNQITFTHEIIRSSVYQCISEHEVADLHMRIGAYLESNRDGDTAPSMLSWHFYKGGDADRCVKYSLQAARNFRDRFSVAESIELYSRALEVMEVESHGLEWAEAVEGLADAFDESCNNAQAFKFYERLLDTLGPGPDMARILRKCAECFFPQRLGRGDINVSADLLGRIDDTWDLPSQERGEISAARALIAAYHGDFQAYEKGQRSAIAHFKEAGAYRRAAWELSTSSGTDLMNGKIAECKRKLDEAFDLYTDHPWPRGEMQAHYDQGIHHYYCGLLAEAFTNFDRSAQLARTLGDQQLVTWSETFQGLIRGWSGDHTGAISFLEKAHDSSLQSLSSYLPALPAALLSYDCSKLGRLSEAAMYIGEAKKIIDPPNIELKTPLWGIVTALNGYWMAGNDDDDWEKQMLYGLALIEGTYMNQLFEPSLHLWYSEALKVRGRNIDAIKELELVIKAIRQQGWPENLLYDVQAMWWERIKRQG